VTESEHVRETVRRKYAELAIAAPARAVCCGPGDACFGPAGYTERDLGQLPQAAANASLGCGNPAAVAALAEGEVVLDLGSGGGVDVILSARRIGPTGRAYGLDMTDEMLDLARRNAAEAGVGNVEFLKGHIEDIPLPDASVDVVISNCVINLSSDKARVLREVARVLRPGGRLAVSDVVADDDMDEATRRDMELWTGCIAGALTRGEYLHLLDAAGLTDAKVEETHRVHSHAGSAILRARKPSAQPASPAQPVRSWGS
jgi:SAM-dependent methyltransferase